MKKAVFIALSLLSVSLLVSGCATVKAASEDGRTFIAGECSSWRLLWCIPLFGGDCEDPNDNFCVWFRNTATLEDNVKLFEYACARKGARGVKDVKIFVDDTHFFFVFRRTTLFSSAELVY